MTSQTRVTKEELRVLIENAKNSGQNSEGLEALLAEVENEEADRNPPRRPRRDQMDLGLKVEDATTQQRLSVEVGALFPDGITDEVLEELIAYDRDHTMEELKEMCKEAGLSTSGHKKKLAARLIAAGGSK